MEDRDHDILIEVKVICNELKKDFENHLTHHFRYTLVACGIALTALVTMAIALIKVL